MTTTLPSEILEYANLQNGENAARSLSEQAYRYIRRQIISTQLPPGSVIDEAALKAELGMGRTPIREALQRLSIEKLVTILPRRGMLVTEIGITDLKRLFEVRFELEGLAAQLAAQRGTEEQFGRMEAVLSYLPDPGEEVDPRQLIAIDEASHRLIYEAADNKFLRDSLLTLYGQSLRLWYFTLSQIGALQEAVEEHRLILAALMARDGQQAKSLIQAHVQTFHERKQAAMLGGQS
jgi:DNA-binding GntR family transcriptional regulator